MLESNKTIWHYALTVTARESERVRESKTSYKLINIAPLHDSPQDKWDI